MLSAKRESIFIYLLLICVTVTFFQLVYIVVINFIRKHNIDVYYFSALTLKNIRVFKRNVCL